jgi:hypothetical protein
MFPAREANRKGKLMAKSNKATRDIRAWDRGRIPCIKKEQDCLKSHTNRIMLVAHYLAAFIEIPFDAPNDHWVVICT